MRVLIIGGGLIGVTSAYFLRRAGHDVVVLDRQSAVGRETSFANGALMTPSMADPWNAPGVWRLLLSSIGRSTSPMKLRLRQLPGLIGWGCEFLRNSAAPAFRSNTVRNLKLALYSLDVMKSLRDETGIGADHNPKGTLRIFRDRATWDRACAAAAGLSEHGLTFRPLSPDAMIALEPALATLSGQLAGGIHYGLDKAGDAHQFCLSLAEEARKLGAQFQLGVTVSPLELSAGRIAGVVSGRRLYMADSYVIAAGSYSVPLLRNAGVHLPIRPVKGYSVTLSDFAEPTPLRIPIVDDQLHAAVVPLGSRIRVAGTAEFAGYDLTVRQERVRNLLALFERVLPQVPIDSYSIESWCGLRPVSADGVPIIGETTVPNLLVNTGHGHLGWTMAAGSGKLLADLISGRPTSLAAEPFSLNRFSAH